MSTEWLIPMLFLAGLVLLIGELLLPTHGVLGAMGLVAVVGGIGYAFRMNVMLGTGLLAGTVLASPIAFALAMRIYPRTPIGRRMILSSGTDAERRLIRVGIGDLGQAISDLRPAGQCQFATGEYEAHSEGPLIRAGGNVRVVNIDSGRIVVRAV
jgi:membrane-bound ClpP family serine protease